jgi:hypothetical protein
MTKAQAEKFLPTVQMQLSAIGAENIRVKIVEFAPGVWTIEGTYERDVTAACDTLPLMDQDQKDAIVQAASSAAASLNTLQAKVPVSDTKNTAALANAYKAIGECQADYQG